MANKNLFGSALRGSTPKAFDVVNEAGGRAYSTSDESGLAQYVITGALNGTFYAGGDEQLDKVLSLANGCSDEFLAKVAVYAREVGRMKDTPALLAAILSTRGENALVLLEKVFSRVINNQKQLRNFVQIVRSGRVGRKSFGTAVKRMIQTWLRNQDEDQLFYQSVGNAPSLADVVKMVHVKPKNKTQEAFFGWLLSRKYNKRYLPALLKAFEKYKADPVHNEVPKVDFRMLTALELGTEQWTAIAKNASWNTLRMNLNTFQRHGVLNDRDLVHELAAKLANAEAVRKNNAFPYQLLTTFQAVEGIVPLELSNALQDAMETATENVPAFDGDVAVCVDTSGSMSSPVTGMRAGSTTKTKCVDIAGLVAASVLRKNPNSVVVPFDTTVHPVQANPRDSVMTNAQKFARSGGGTDCASALRYIISQSLYHLSAVIYISDNESWYMNSPTVSGIYCRYIYGSSGTTMAQAWAKYKSRNRKAKLVCIDIQPYSTVQVIDDKDVLNIGGFTDNVFEVLANFINGDSRNFKTVIDESVTL